MIFKSVALSVLLCLSWMPAQAADLFITEVEDEVEIKTSSGMDYVDKTALGKLPLKVLGSDDDNFFKVRGPDKKVMWVNSSFVTTSEEDGRALYGKVNCHTVSVAKKSDKKQYGARGVSEECD